MSESRNFWLFVVVVVVVVVVVAVVAVVVVVGGGGGDGVGVGGGVDVGDGGDSRDNVFLTHFKSLATLPSCTRNMFTKHNQITQLK